LLLPVIGNLKCAAFGCI